MTTGEKAPSGPGLLADLRRPINPIRRVLRVLRWQLGWALSQRPLLLLSVQFAGALRTVLQGAVILLLRSGLSNPDQSRFSLIAAMVGLLAAAGVAAFAFRLGITRLATLFEAHVTSAVVDRGIQTSGPAAASIAFPGARFAGRSAAIAFTGVGEAMRTLVLLALALFLDATLVLVVSALVAPTLLVQIILNRRVHRNAAGRKSLVRQLRKALSATLSREGPSRSGSEFVAQPAFKDQLRGYQRYLNATAYAELTAGVSIAIGIVFAVVWLFDQDIATSAAQFDVTAKAVALLFFLQSLGAVLRSLAGFTRLFSRSEAVYLFAITGVSQGSFEDDGMQDDGF